MHKTAPLDVRKAAENWTRTARTPRTANQPAGELTSGLNLLRELVLGKDRWGPRPAGPDPSALDVDAPSALDVDASRPGSRRSIRQAMRLYVWNRDVGPDERVGRCAVRLQPVRMERFHAAHWVAVARGGADHADNLRVACSPCNLSLGTTPMRDFIALMRAQRD